MGRARPRCLRGFTGSASKTASDFSYHGLVHRAGALFEEQDFIDGENAIVDFKYSASTKVTWWFDHHLSAFLTPEDQRDFERGQGDGSQRMRKFYDPNYISCTSFIAHVGGTSSASIQPLAELIKWADIVDGARYESAKAAVEMAAPAMKLTMVIESTPDDTLVQAADSAADGDAVAGACWISRFVQELLGPLMERHWAGRGADRVAGLAGKGRDHVRYHGSPDGGVQQVHPVLPVSGRRRTTWG